MKKTLSILFLLIVVFLVSACTSQSPTPSLPTAAVPALSDIEYAQELWSNAGIPNYYLVINETRESESKEIRLVIEENQVLAAQVISDDSTKSVLSKEEAEQYRVENLLEKLYVDASGEGDAQYNMQVTFDEDFGFPVLVYAEAITSYTEDGKLKLNSEYSYNYVSSFDLLLEDIYGVGKDSLLVLKRSGGVEAWCDTLRVFDDGTAMYTNNCDQALLNMKPPAADYDKLVTLLEEFGSLDEIVEDQGGTLDLVVTGSGNGEISSTDYEELWALVDRFTDLLTNPVGEGLTLLYTVPDSIYGLNMMTLMGQPATIDFSGSLYGGVVNNTLNLLVFVDDEGINGFNLEDGTAFSLVTNPAGKAPYKTLVFDDAGYILIYRLSEDGYTELAWFNTTNNDLKDIGQSLKFGCDLQAASTEPGKVLISSAAGDCTAEDLTTGLYSLDMGTGAFEAVSGLEDGDVSGLNVNQDVAQALFVVENQIMLLNLEDGSQKVVAGLPEGSLYTPVNRDGQGFYFSLQNLSASGIYWYDWSTDTAELIFAGEGIRLIGLSPGNEILLFNDPEMDLNAYTFTRDEVLPIHSAEGDAFPQFVGWMVTEIEE